jgi:nitrogen fixation/metabolism regulation signal transduction histidine kinase
LPNPTRPRRIPLGKTSRRLSFERRLRIWLAGLALPALLFGGLLLVKTDASVATIIASLLVFAFLWLIAVSAFTEQIIRPMQTLANVVAALREDDFSFRARGARRGDALGDLALEINALAGTLQAQRSTALEALTLLERVMTSMQSPVLAFDAQDRLRLHNAAADRAFALKRPASDGRTAEELHLRELLNVTDEGTYSDTSKTANATRYVVRRATFRLRGVPHALLVLSDVGAALREEERQAWQRLIRVLGHEINNSLTPIKSIAGSLRSRLPDVPDGGQSKDLDRDMARGLAVIEDRAASLNRFLQAYQQLSTLPAPRVQPVPLRPLLERITHLEQRLRVELAQGPEITLLVDPDQLQQALINLVQNAVDASLEAAGEDREKSSVTISWDVETESAIGKGVNERTSGRPVPAAAIQNTPQAIIRIVDNGLGLLNPVNLFVPFYTTKPKGTGIGLALAQQILLVHKGAVSLTNRTDGQGCVAEVRLPLSPASA